MARRNYNDDDDEDSYTFSEDYRSQQKAKYMSASSVRLASHSKTRVAYFHDEGVGNYHYGVREYPYCQNKTKTRTLIAHNFYRNVIL